MSYTNKKLIAALIGIILMIGNNIIAQTILSQKTFGGRLTETVSQISATLDNGFIVAANTSSLNGDVIGYHEGFGSDCWITKLNFSNQLQWQRTIGGSGNDVATAVRATADSGFIVAGYSNSNDGDISGNHGGYDFLVVKLDKNDSILWQKSIGGSGNDFATDIKQTNDGGFIVAGYSNSSDSLVSGNHGANDFWIVKLTADGTIQWQKSYGGTSDDKATAIQQTSDDGYIVAGFSNSNDGDLNNNNGNNDYWVIKLSSNGTLQWQKSLGGSSNDFATAVLQSIDGGYMVVGYTFSIDGDVTNNHGNTDYWLVKLDGNGKLKWQRTYGGSENDYARSTIQTKDGGFVVGGYTASVDGDVTTNQGMDDEWVIRTDSLGNQLWQKTLGGSNNDRLFSISKADGTNLSLIGITNSTDGDIPKNQGSYDCWVVKMADATILPIKLVSFNAVLNNKSILLDWKMANETKMTSKFIVERSNDGFNFKQISIVIAKGNGNGNYQLTDYNPATNINYYRIKIVDNDDSYTYSKVVTISLNNYFPPLITVSPNPFRGNLSLIVCATENSVASLIVTSINGSLLVNKKYTLSKGNNALKVTETNTLSKGIYMLTIKIGEVLKTISIEKE